MTDCHCIHVWDGGRVREQVVHQLIIHGMRDNATGEQVRRLYIFIRRGISERLKVKSLLVFRFK